MFYVYRIINITNNKFYVGRTKNTRERFKTHKNYLKRNKHHCRYLQNSWNKYGEDNFRFELLDEFESVEESIEVEQYYLDTYYGIRLYNQSKNSGGGDNITYNPNRETILKNMSEATLKRYATMSEDDKLRMSLMRLGENNPMYGKSHSEESKKLMSIKHKEYFEIHDSYRKGKTFEELFSEEKCLELKSNLSNIAKSRTGEKNSFYGKCHSEETKSKISEKRKGVLPSNIRPVLIDGIEYESATAAARCLGVVTATILHRIKSKNEKFKNYYYK